MSDELPKPPPRVLVELPLAACWLNVFVAAAAMAGTIPCRVYGLGLITEPLLKDFGFTRTEFGAINFWATMITTACGLGTGWIVTRYGTRRSYRVVVLALAAATALPTVVNGYHSCRS